MLAFIQGTPGETYVADNRLAMANLDSALIQEITPQGFANFYEIAWKPN